MINWFNNLDKSIKRAIVGGIVIVVIAIIIVFILGSLNNRKLSYEKLENKIKNAAITYYEKFPEKLPQSEGGEVKLNVSELIDAGLIKKLSVYNDDQCDANVYVQNNGDKKIYIVYLDCENYVTNTLANYIKKGEVVTEGNGLYNYGDEFVYRGDKINNYIKFSNKIWRILRINSDNSIRIIEIKSKKKNNWDNRYNIDFNEYVGINDFEVSRIKDFLLKYGNDKNIKKESTKWIVSKKACLDKKDSINFSNLVSLECLNYSEEKYQFLLPQVEEYYIASIDSNCNKMRSASCTNYNYLSSGVYWTLTPSAKYSNKVYTIGSNMAKLNETDRSFTVRFVTNLSQHVLYDSGDGSYENPYTIQE